MGTAFQRDQKTIAELRAVNKQLLAACEDAVLMSQHADGCQWFDIPTKELNGTPQSQTRQLSACNCHLKACRAAIAKVKGEPK